MEHVISSHSGGGSAYLRSRSSPEGSNRTSRNSPGSLSSKPKADLYPQPPQRSPRLPKFWSRPRHETIQPRRLAETRNTRPAPSRLLADFRESPNTRQRSYLPHSPGAPNSPEQALFTCFGPQSRYYLHTWNPAGRTLFKEHQAPK